MTTVAEVLNRLAEARNKGQFNKIWIGYNLTIRRQEKRHKPVDKDVLRALMNIEQIVSINARKRNGFSRLTELNTKWR